MHKTLIEALEYSLQNRSDCLVELEEDLLKHKALMFTLAEKKALIAFTSAELNNRRLNLNYMGGKAEFLIRLNGSHYSLDHTEISDEGVSKNVDEYYVFQLHYKYLFAVIAKANKLKPINDITLNDVFSIGSLKVKDKKIAWFFCAEVSEKLLSLIPSYGYDYVILSTPYSMPRLQDTENIFFHVLNYDVETWTFDFCKIINPKNEFSVQEYVEVTGKELVLDSETDSIYLNGVKLPGSSNRAFTYVRALTIAGTKGLYKKDFIKHLTLAESQSRENVANVDKTRLKQAINKAFTNDSEKQSALKLLDLEKNAEKGDLVRINLTPDQIKIF